MEGNAATTFLSHDVLREWHSMFLVVRFLFFSLLLLSIIPFFNVFQVNANLSESFLN